MESLTYLKCFLSHHVMSRSKASLSCLDLGPAPSSTPSPSQTCHPYSVTPRSSNHLHIVVEPMRSFFIFSLLWLLDLWKVSYLNGIWL